MVAGPSQQPCGSWTGPSSAKKKKREKLVGPPIGLTQLSQAGLISA